MRVKHSAFAAFIASFACLLSACSNDPAGTGDETGAPPPLAMAIRTDDAADRILLTSVQDPTTGTQVRICLQVATPSGWWKGIGANREDPTVEGEAGNVYCSLVAPGRVAFTFWKAKLFGVHTRVGSTTIDLARYAGHRATFTWQQD